MGKELKREPLAELGVMVSSIDLCKVTTMKQKHFLEMPQVLPAEIKCNIALEVVGLTPEGGIVLMDRENGHYKRTSLDVYLSVKMENAGMSHEEINKEFNDWYQLAISTYRQLFYK